MSLVEKRKYLIVCGYLHILIYYGDIPDVIEKLIYLFCKNMEINVGKANIMYGFNDIYFAAPNAILEYIKMDSDYGTSITDIEFSDNCLILNNEWGNKILLKDDINSEHFFFYQSDWKLCSRNGDNIIICTNSNDIYQLRNDELDYIDMSFNYDIVSIKQNNRGCWFLDKMGNVYRYYNLSYYLEKIKSLKNIKTIECCKYIYFCLDIHGRIYGFQNNTEYIFNKSSQIALNDIKQINYFSSNKVKLTDIKCGEYHLLCLTNEGHIYAFGSNVNGQCGVSKYNHKYIHKPINIESDFNPTIIQSGYTHNIITCNSDYYSFGSNNNYKCLQMVSDQYIDKPTLINTKMVMKQHNLSNILTIIPFKSDTFLISLN